MSAMSPWGEVQHVTATDMRGISFVSTASHGGLRISQGVAKKHFTPKILSASMFYGGYYFFEEDCAWMVPAFFSEVIYNAITKFVKSTREELGKSLEQSYPELFNLVFMK